MYICIYITSVMIQNNIIITFRDIVLRASISIEGIT